MAPYCLIPLSSFVLFFIPIYAQTSQSAHHLQRETSIFWEAQSNFTHGNVTQNPKTTDSISERGHPLTRHHQYNLQKVDGILVVIGWGTLVPIGVIVARYLRKYPMQCHEWYSFHAFCQTVGYILGSVGWCLAMWLPTSSHKYLSNTQRTLSIVAFTVLNLQMLSIFVRTRKEGYLKWWIRCHQVLGYVTVAIIITANIFEGINNQSERLKWVYLGILAVFALTAAFLEIFTCIKSRMLKHSMQLNTTFYTTSP